MRMLTEKEIRGRLKSCSCGNPNLVVSIEPITKPNGDPSDPYVYIKCKNCKASLFDDMFIAIHKWNKRIDLYLSQR